MVIDTVIKMTVHLMDFGELEWRTPHHCSLIGAPSKFKPDNTAVNVFEAGTFSAEMLPHLQARFGSPSIPSSAVKLSTIPISRTLLLRSVLIGDEGRPNLTPQLGHVHLWTYGWIFARNECCTWYVYELDCAPNKALFFLFPFHPRRFRLLHRWLSP